MYPFDFVRFAARRSPDNIAVTDGVTAWSFASLVTNADTLAASLQDLAGATRVTVGICGANSLAQFVAIMAVHACGGILVPLNYRNSPMEIAAQIKLVQPHILVVDEEFLDLVGVPEGVALVVGETLAPDRFERSVQKILVNSTNRSPRWPSVTAGDASAIKFTGGSSGKPKGVVQSFRCIMTLISNFLYTFELGSADRHICVAPISHGAGTLMLPILAVGGCNRLVRKADPDTIGQMIERERITTIFFPPTLAYALMDADSSRRHVRSSLRHAIYGGAPMPPARVREARDYYCDSLETVYGQTEVPALISAMRAIDFVQDDNLASSGRITPFVRAKIVGADGQLLGVGEIGEVIVRSDMSMSGYYEMPEETSRTIVDGWVHTGDLGYLDDRGFLYLKDRLRDVVISGGFNVYPSDVEAALATHPDVREVVVFGVPDDKWGERVEAAVELSMGANATAEGLASYARTLLGSLKSPKQVHIVETLPRSPVGKVLRRAAREQVVAHMAAREG